MNFSILALCVFLFLGAGCARVPKPGSPPPPAAIFHAPSPRTAPSPVFHLVKPKQTLYSIAKAYGTSVKDLMRANGISDSGRLDVGRRLLIPTAGFEPLAPSYERPPSLEEVERLLGPGNPIENWQTVTVHHSATRKGDGRHFHRDHLRRRMGGLFYHFVIGNGSYTREGEIETGWRWKKQVKANRPYDIQICLVGDFSRDQISETQFESLANLIAVLRRRYGIPLDHVRKHQDIKGKHTECPGRYFPFHRLLHRLAELSTR